MPWESVDQYVVFALKSRCVAWAARLSFPPSGSRSRWSFVNPRLVGLCREFQDNQPILHETLFLKKKKSVAGDKSQKSFAVLRNSEVGL